MTTMMMTAGTLCAVAATGLLRLSWGRAMRSIGLNAGAWALMIVGLAIGGAAHGAWGMAVVTLAAMLTAFAALAHAGFGDSAKPQRASTRRANILPERAPLRLGRRVVTFMMTGPLALAAAMLACMAVRLSMRLAGAHAADGTMTALMLLPLFWAVLIAAMLMAERRRTQGLVAAVPALLGGLVLAAGG